MSTQNTMRAVSERLGKIDLDSLTDEQAIAYAQAVAALTGARAQVDTAEHLVAVLSDRFTRLLYNLDCTYRKKFGTFPEQEQW